MIDKPLSQDREERKRCVNVILGCITKQLGAFSTITVVEALIEQRAPLDRAQIRAAGARSADGGSGDQRLVTTARRLLLRQPRIRVELLPALAGYT